MPSSLYFVSASAFPLEAIADLYTRTFADYYYDALVTPGDMAEFVHADHLDLNRSPVMVVDGEQAGLATVGLRGDESYCKGFGVTPLFRGQGLSSALCGEVVRQARLAGAHRLTLAVLQNNERAVKTYLRAGFCVSREMFSFEWRADDDAGEMKIEPSAYDPASLLDCFTRWHAFQPTWERDLPTLRALCALNRLHGTALVKGGETAAYALYRRLSGSPIELMDVAAEQVEHASALLASLQRGGAHIACHNEPADSPMREAFRTAGFRETLKRYEMEMRW